MHPSPLDHPRRRCCRRWTTRPSCRQKQTHTNLRRQRYLCQSPTLRPRLAILQAKCNWQISTPRRNSRKEWLARHPDYSRKARLGRRTCRYSQHHRRLIHCRPTHHSEHRTGPRSSLRGMLHRRSTRRYSMRNLLPRDAARSRTGSVMGIRQAEPPLERTIIGRKLEQRHHQLNICTD